MVQTIFQLAVVMLRKLSLTVEPGFQTVPSATFGDSYDISCYRPRNNRSRDRSVPVDEMKEIINRHDHRQQQHRGEHGGFVYKFRKQTTVVIAEVRGSEAWV